MASDVQSTVNSARPSNAPTTSEMPSQGAAIQPIDRLSRVKILSEILSTWVTLIALIVGGGFALKQYLDKVQDDRIKVTFEFLDRYGKTPYIEARETLRAGWARHSYDLDILLSKPNLTKEEYGAFILKVIEVENLEGPFYMIIDFYDSLQVCDIKEICDQKTSRALFQREARDMFVLHYQFLQKERTRRKNDSFAMNLQTFAVSK